MAQTNNELVFLPLGGSGEIGMNFNAYGFGPPDEKQWVLVDCGILFGREGNVPGVDVIVPDTRFLEERREDILGLIVTHGHEDHIGAIAYLWPKLKCPIYATPFTAQLVAGKLAEAGLSGKAELNAIPLDARLELGPFEISCIHLTHSIPEPTALEIRTPLGTLVHTGDWKLDPDPLVGDPPDFRHLRALGKEGVLALICDSTNATVPGNSGSEAKVRESMFDLIAGLKGRIAVTAFASNVARLETVAKAAEAAGRKVALVGRTMNKVIAAAKFAGYLTDFPEVLDEEEAASLDPDDILYLCTGSQGEPRAAMARIARGEHPYVHLGPGDTVIFSSRIIPGNELGIYAMQNALTALGVDVLDPDDAFVHVSGHPAQDELRQMYHLLDPAISVPVHGELRHQSAHARLAKSMGVKTIVPGVNGQMLRLAPGPVKVADEVPFGRIHVDGAVLVPEEDGIARQRRAVGYAGFIAISIALDKRRKIAGAPSIIMTGIPDVVEDAIQEAVTDAMDRYNPKRQAEELLCESVRKAARGAASDVWNKKPVTKVEILWV